MRTSVLFIAAAMLQASCIVIQPTLQCANSAACASDEYCAFPSNDACGHKGAIGTCSTRPAVCPEYASLVCGCDGVTYANPCVARGARIDVARAGACDDACVASDAHGTGACTLVLGWYFDGSACVAISGCTCVGVDCTHGTATQAACEAAHASCVTRPCSPTVSCAAGDWCDYAEGSNCGGGGTGICRARPTACPPVVHEVCGCDGHTYASDCDAQVAGTDVAYDGVCTSGSICGGFAGFRCTDREWCDYPPATLCGAADQTGSCRPRPEACITIYNPVCGCDARTYGNSCEAARNGTDVAYVGECGTACAIIPTLSRACGSDEGCVVAVHQINCCGTLVAAGLAVSEQTRFDSLEPVCRASYPLCGCPTMQTTTDNGEIVTDLSNVHVGCILRGATAACVSYVDHRPPDAL